MLDSIQRAADVPMEGCIDHMAAWERGLKRAGDCLGALLGLVALSPVMLAIYVMQKIAGGGPAIFVQERIGMGGRPFHIYKFRTMVVAASAEEETQLAQKDDARVTRLGRFLRSHHLDELPQLWNVFVGDMSFVGYRPEQPFHVAKIMAHDPRYALLYCSRPGVTSHATIYNGYTDTLEKMLTRLEMDLDYLRRRTLALDCKIIYETLAAVCSGKKF